MPEINNKVKWNALISYFMVVVNLGFLMSKNPDVSHPFVKHHVKSAFTLHLLLLGMFFIMSYPFLDGISLLWYSLNTLITIALSMSIFAGMLYGMLQAHRGKTATLGEMFGAAGVSKNMLQNKKTEEISEEDQSALILCHVPFFGYIIYPKYKKLPHISDIIKINFLVTLLACFILIAGYISLASIIMLAYTIWSVFNCSKLVISKEISTPDLSMIPSMQESYLMLISALAYSGNSMKKNTFVPFRKILEEKAANTFEQEKENLEKIKSLPKGKFPGVILYIPILNIIWIFSMKTRDAYHAKNGLVLTVVFLVMCFVFYRNSDVFLLLLFPVCFWIWYLQRKAYQMPYVYDIYAFIAWILWKIGSIFSKTRKLQKTQVSESIKMWGNKTEKKES